MASRRLDVVCGGYRHAQLDEREEVQILGLEHVHDRVPFRFDEFRKAAFEEGHG